MPGVESLIPTEWYAEAEKDLAAARVLFGDHPSLRAIAAFHLQQAVEKYFKGFLLAKGWALKRIHDLVRLLGDVVTYDASLSRFGSICGLLTEYYFEGRYPFFPTVAMSEAEAQQMLIDTEELIAELKRRI